MNGATMGTGIYSVLNPIQRIALKRRKREWEENDTWFV